MCAVGNADNDAVKLMKDDETVGRSVEKVSTRRSACWDDTQHQIHDCP